MKNSQPSIQKSRMPVMMSEIEAGHGQTGL